MGRRGDGFRLTPLPILQLLWHVGDCDVIRFDPHAEFQIERRGIPRSWIEKTLRSWDETEARGGKRSFLKCYPERGKKLRVVVRENDHEYVITAYFDRRKPCA